MSKQPAGEQQAINNSNQAFSQMDQMVQQLLSEWTGLALPQIKALYPMLQATIAGTATPMSRAAQAPVAQQTSRTIGQIGTELGGVTNPNALIKDLNVGSTQSAGLAESSTIDSALRALQGLIGTQAGLTGTGLEGLGTAAKGEADLAGLLAQQPSPFQQTLSGIGTLGGLAFGAMSGDPFSSAGALQGASGPTGWNSPYGSTENQTP
jgi:hypothetical protein